MNGKHCVANCCECGQYRAIVLDGLCSECAREDMRLLDAANFFADSKRDARASEIAEYLEIAEARVVHWAMQGKVDCVFVEKDCEQCNHHMINQLVCPHCGTPTQHAWDEAEPECTLEQRSARVVFIQKMNQHHHRR